MKMRYKTQGICSQFIEVEIENNYVSKLNFIGGCHGNLQAISKLVVGMPVSEVISRLNGIRCGSKDSSCSDQLCRALEQLSLESTTSLASDNISS